MFTPAERRGALIVALLFALGAARDLWRATHPRWTEPPAPLVTPVSAAPPGRGDPVPDSTGAASTLDRSRPDGAIPPLDLNRASVSDLDGLPGIGPVLARRIVEHRSLHGRFRSAEELLAVRGIGPKLFARLEPRVVAGPAVTDGSRHDRTVRGRVSPP